MLCPVDAVVQHLGANGDDFSDHSLHWMVSRGPANPHISAQLKQPAVYAQIDMEQRRVCRQCSASILQEAQPDQIISAHHELCIALVVDLYDPALALLMMRRRTDSRPHRTPCP